jgi:translation elongation factor P/translation initiation factor 5A
VKLQEFLHVKPGKGSAFVRTKIKNLINGSVQERTFRAGESITGAEVYKCEMQYTYSTPENLCFMNMETFEEQIIDRKKIDNMDFLLEGTFIRAYVQRVLVQWRSLTQCNFRLTCIVSIPPPSMSSLRFGLSGERLERPGDRRRPPQPVCLYRC